MRAPDLHRLFDRLRGRRLASLVAITVAVPVLVSLGVAAHFWSTAGRLASYRPAEPSRLYAAPLVLRVGGPVDPVTLVADLRSLGYRRTSGAPGIGEMRVGAEALKIGLRRDARVGGGSRAAGASTLEVLFDSGRVRALHADGRALGSDAAVSLGRPLLYTYYDAELRECLPLRLDELPRHVVGAVLAAEDAGFFRHQGVAPVGIARAAWQDLRSGEVRSSTGLPEFGITGMTDVDGDLWIGTPQGKATIVRPADR